MRSPSLGSQGKKGVSCRVDYSKWVYYVVTSAPLIKWGLLVIFFPRHPGSFLILMFLWLNLSSSHEISPEGIFLWDCLHGRFMESVRRGGLTSVNPILMSIHVLGRVSFTQEQTLKEVLDVTCGADPTLLLKRILRTVPFGTLKDVSPDFPVFFLKPDLDLKSYSPFCSLS